MLGSYARRELEASISENSGSEGIVYGSNSGHSILRCTGSFLFKKDDCGRELCIVTVGGGLCGSASFHGIRTDAARNRSARKDSRTGRVPSGISERHNTRIG